MNNIRRKRNALLSDRIPVSELKKTFKHPSNAANNGMAFEKEIVTTCQTYKALGVARIEKVAPPTLVTGSRKHNTLKTVHLSNPFLDFIGCVSNPQDKRASFPLSAPITIECKSTTKPRLSISGKSGGGISATQWATMQEWRLFGFTVWVLWQYDGKVKWITVPEIIHALSNNQKSIKWSDSGLVKRGNRPGIIWDFLQLGDK